VRRYRQYLDACNRRSWDEVGAFVAERVLVNGSVFSRREYVAAVVATTSTFPDYQWELRRAVLEGDWLAVHLYDTGTRAGDLLGADGDNAHVETDESNMYRVVDGQRFHRGARGYGGQRSAVSIADPPAGSRCPRWGREDQTQSSAADRTIDSRAPTAGLSRSAEGRASGRGLPSAR
jgi:predicted ester cyclase